MKQLILSFLIIMICSLRTVASGVESAFIQKPDTLSVPDSLELFHDITDISKQVERRAGSSREKGENVIISDKQLLPDSLKGKKSLPSNSPARRPVYTIPLDTTPKLKNPLDSLYVRKPNGTLQLPEYKNPIETMTGFTLRDTIFYNPLFLPMIFTGKILPRELMPYPTPDERDKGVLIPQDETFAPRLEQVDFVRSVRRDFYHNYPDKIRYSVASFESISSPITDDKDVKETFNPFRELLKAETNYSLEAPGVSGAKIGRKYWIRNGEHSFHFAQNYFSENWHQGGNNNLNFISNNIFKVNYKKEKVTFNNTIEWRLSLYNAPDDSLRNYRIGNDLFRYYGDFGLDAFIKKWSYSMNLEAKSQLFNAYPVNSNDIRSSFLSPLYVNAGIGLKYHLKKASPTVRKRDIDYQLTIAPISINYTYVSNSDVNETRFGIEDGKKSKLDLGSTLTSILKFNITRYVTWDSRITYFTSYERVIMEFINSLDLALSNAFSTRIYLNMRFDDGVPSDPTFELLQMNQSLSFGLNYKW